MNFTSVTTGILQGLASWEDQLLLLPETVLTQKHNSQNRTIKQIIGHMVDSASNNTHRIIHLQYQTSPLTFPNYAANGNNDRWIAIQNYQEENWPNLIQLWKYSHLHLVHIINNVRHDQLSSEWDSTTTDGNIALKDMITDFLRHFRLHLHEITQLIEQ